LRKRVEVNPDWCKREILLFQDETICPESEIQPCRVEEIWTIFEDSILIFKVEEDNCEESFRT